jgi:hypothetical protein
MYRWHFLQAFLQFCSGFELRQRPRKAENLISCRALVARYRIRVGSAKVGHQQLLKLAIPETTASVRLVVRKTLPATTCPALKVGAVLPFPPRTQFPAGSNFASSLQLLLVFKP